MGEFFGRGEMKGVCKAEDTKLNRFSWFNSSPKGIDIPIEGNALGSDPHSIITTLKGLNTRGAYAAITSQSVGPHCVFDQEPITVSFG
jgi:hypothetical protein